MRRPVIDNVEIVEPPIGELTKKRSGFKRTCLSGCGCVFIFIIGAIIALKLAVGPGPQTLKTVPEYFPKDIPVYDADNIESITFISGQYKNRGVEIAALFPKLILSPLLVNNQTAEDEHSRDSRGIFKDFVDVISRPVGDHRDTVQIKWVDMNADHEFVINYYMTELKKKNFTIEAESEGKNMNKVVKQFSFQRESDKISGSMYVEGPVNGRGTSYASLIVNIAP
jgi:hypothetical protein